MSIKVIQSEKKKKKHMLCITYGPVIVYSYFWICCSLCDISSTCLFSLLSCSRTRLSSCIWSCVAFFFSSCRSETCTSFMVSRAVCFSRALRSNSACLECTAARQQHSTSHLTAAKQPWTEVIYSPYITIKFITSTFYAYFKYDVFN